jgi:hypothetical protein
MDNTTALARRATTPERSVLQHDYILLDTSASMVAQWGDVRDSINAYLEGLRRGNVKSQIILHQFNSYEPNLITYDVPIDQMPPHIEVEGPGGKTPLYDAIALMGMRLRDLDPPRAAVLIVTDGDEMGSKFADLQQARAILDWIRAKGWQVTFIGANFNNEQQAAFLGADATSAIGVSTRRLVDATRELAKKRARHFLYGTPMSWSEEDQQNFGGYLGGPNGA